MTNSPWDMRAAIAFLALALACATSRPSTAAAPTPSAQQNAACSAATYQSPLRPSGVQSGYTSLAPGMWWNPSKPGHGWNFMQQLEYPSSEATKLYLVWFTYDQSGYPVWYWGEFQPLMSTPTQWSGDIYRYTWNGNLQAGGTRNAPQDVGDISVTYVNGTRTRATVAWSLNAHEFQAAASDIECLIAFNSEDGGNLPVVGAGSESGWDVLARSGNGLVMQFINTPTGGVWSSALATYDSAGKPIWLQDFTNTVTGQTPSATVQVTHVKGYCPGCPVVGRTLTPSGTMRFAFVEPGEATALFRPAISLSTPTARNAIAWSSTTDLTIERTARIGWIEANPTSCSASPCSVTLSWRIVDGYPGAAVYAVDPASPGNPVLVNSGVTDNRAGSPYTLPVGVTRYFELRTGTQSNAGVFDRTANITGALSVAPDQTIQSLASELPAHNAGLGAMDAIADVVGGAAAYTIPIQVPPGRRGMQPELALVYGSRDGAGLGGLGLSVSGLSSIHRCPATPEQDGVVRPVAFQEGDGGDRLCLDGQRLVKVAGGQYGYAGTQYRKEIDDFTRVTLDSTAGNLNTPTSFFKVELKSGEIRYYGGVTGASSGLPGPVTVGARTIPGGVTSPLAWLIARREDPLGNNVIFSYRKHGDGEYLIEKIEYTGSAGAAGDRRVAFIYLPRSDTASFPDQSSSFLAGSVTRQTMRLDKIQTFTQTEQVREYRIGGYGASPVSSRGRPTSITECAFESGVPTCRAATTFTWQDPASVPPAGELALKMTTAPLNLPGLPTPHPGVPGGLVNTPIKYRQAADFDGDGAAEMSAYVRTGGDSFQTYLVSLTPDRQVRAYYALPPNTFHGSDPASSGRLTFPDYDNDGRADLTRTYNGYFAISWWSPTSGAGNFGNGSFNDPPYQPGDGTPSNNRIALGASEWIESTADFNGDGRSDLLVNRSAASTKCPGGRWLELYFNTTANGAPNVTFASTSPTQTCLPVDSSRQSVVDRVGDLDGNGLPDVVAKLGLGSSSSEPWARTTAGDFVLFGQRSTAGSCPGACGHTWSKKAYSALFPGDATGNEIDQRLFAFWLDVNGDGLDDLLYAGPGGCGSSFGGCWNLRINRGATTGSTSLLGARIVTTSGAGIEFPDVVYGGTPPPGPFKPKYGSLLRVGDIDGDGRTELLVPSSTSPFAAAICDFHPSIAYQTPGVGVCNFIPPSGGGPNAPAGADWDGAVPCGRQFYMCPENPRTDIAIGQTYRSDRGSDDVVLRYSLTSAGTLDASTDDTPIAGFFNATAQTGFLAAARNLNPSIYNLNALRFHLTSAGTIDVGEVAVPGLTTSAIDGSAEFSDVFGDGLVDHAYYSGCFLPGNGECAVPYAIGKIPLDGKYVPQSLFGDPGILAKRTFLSQNLGAGVRTVAGVQRTDLPPLMPDVVLSIQDGAGRVTSWDYFPLGSSADRLSTELPFYTIPASFGASPRYVDDRHYYFTSSMPVVAEMFRSDGIGGLTMASYGYREAMYNHQGRGFRGFRTVLVEDTTNKRRTTTTFEQKYPLTSAVTQVDVHAIRPNGTLGILSSESRAWRCFDTPAVLPTASPVIPRSSACVPPASGTSKTIMPFTDSVVITTYDAAAAESGGAPVAVAVTKVTNADDPALSGSYSTNSGFDVYGNLRASVTETSDLGDGAAGFRRYVGTLRKRSTRVFTAADLAGWWLDRLQSDQVQTRIDFDGSNPLPTGVTNSIQTVAKSYAWNANRTPQSETLQSGITGQQVITTYAYPTTNYGLPSSVTVQASGDTNVTRVTSTTYSTDGYFSATISNAAQMATSTVIRARDGQPSLLVDPNGLRTTMQYDAFGILTRTLYRGASDTVYRLPDRSESWSTCGSNCPPQAYRMHTVVQDGAPTTVEHFDHFGRILRVDTRLLDLTTSAVETRYTSRGLVAQKSEPYRIGTSAVWTTFEEYDVLGRLKKKTVPKQLSGGLGNLKTTYTYVGRQTQIDVADTSVSCPSALQCLTLYRETDALGRITWTQDAIGGQTRYWFDGDGNALAIKDAAAAVTSAAYNAVGHRTSTSDPNMGAWTYTYNALGEVLTRRDARNVTTSFGYDKLGRTTSKSASVDVDANGSPDSVVDTWLFDPPGALGQLLISQRQINSVLEKRSTYTYDSLARPTRRSSQQNQGGGVTQTFVTDTVYDGNYGRPKQLIHPSGDSVWLRYTQYGQLDRESDFPNTQDYRRITAVTERGQSQTEYLGAALTASYAYTGTTGQMTSAIYTKAGSTVRQLGYQYDVFGNVTKQELGVSATTTETYAYDKLMRLTSATRAGGASGVVSYTYDAVGNFRTKSDYSTTIADAYLYTGGTCGGGPNAVKRITLAAAVGSGTRTLCYDPNGNLTDFSTAGGNGEAFAARYDHDNLPYRTVRGGVTVDLTYDADGARVRQSGADGTRLYDGAYEKLLSPAEHKIYLGDYAVLTRPVGGTLRVNYLLKDRLGSVDAVTDSAGTLVETRGSDAFGKPRQGTWADANPPKLGTIANTPRGFTQHEHLNAVALIHMNGRAYDYQLGRFLSVDAVIQFPTNSQSLNPYSYLMNSPLAGTDPSGFSCKAMVGSHDCGHDTGAKGGFTSNTIRTKDANGNTITSTETNFSGGARGGAKMITITGKGLSNGALGGQSVSSAATNSVSGSGQAVGKASQGGGGCGVQAICAVAAATFAGTSATGSGTADDELQGDSLYDAMVERAGEMFEPGLFRAIDATKQAGANAAQYWADKAEATGNPAYHVPGALASTWTEGYAGRTALTLIPFGGGAGAHAARPFWQYFPSGNAAYQSTWLARGWGWRPPYPVGSVAASRLALPAYNSATGVRAIGVPWYRPVWGPRVVAPQPTFGPHAVGGGIEYRVVPFGN